MMGKLDEGLDDFFGKKVIRLSFRWESTPGAGTGSDVTVCLRPNSSSTSYCSSASPLLFSSLSPLSMPFPLFLLNVFLLSFTFLHALRFILFLPRSSSSFFSFSSVHLPHRYQFLFTPLPFPFLTQI